MSPGRFCVGMSMVILVLTMVVVVSEFAYLGEFWIVLWDLHALRLVMMGGAWFLLVGAVFSVNYFCRFGATILAGSVRHQSAAGTPPSRPGRKAHNCHPSRGAVGVSSARAGAQLSPGSTPHRYVTDP